MKLRRKHFLRAALLTVGAAYIVPSNRVAWAAPPTPRQLLLRVRLFGGAEVNHVAVASESQISVSMGEARFTAQRVAVDLPSRTVSLDEGSVPLEGDTIALAGSAPLETSAAANATVLPTNRYAGSLLVRAIRNSLSVVNTVDLESYVASTLVAETSSSWSGEALRAQAIAVRTYGLHAAFLNRQRDFDLKDDTSAQVYRGVDGIVPAFENAAQSTAGQFVSWQNKPADVYYSSACGGHTASLLEIGGEISPDYLAGIADVAPNGRAYCSASPYFGWKNSLTPAALARVVGATPETLQDVTISERWPDGRVKTLTVSRTDGSVQMSGRAFYSTCMSQLGYKVIPSTFFDIQHVRDQFVVTGHGVGHGVGLCQWGSRGRANDGLNATQIVQAYFPGTTIQTV